MRTFAYCRVSTFDQDTDNQAREIAAAGFAIEPQRLIAETVSGSIPAHRRPGFQKLRERLERGDRLIVTKLDRLGRDVGDVLATVIGLAADGVQVHCLALGGLDLTSAAGKMTMGVLASVAQFERDLLIERTQAGLQRAKAEGKRLGRPEATKTRASVQSCKARGLSQSVTAAVLGCSLRTVKRHWSDAA